MDNPAGDKEEIKVVPHYKGRYHFNFFLIPLILGVVTKVSLKTFSTI
jgi:hypothetical protein